MAVESSQIPEKTVEQIFDERYPLDKWKDSNYSILDKFSMRGRKGFVTGAAGGLGRNAARREENPSLIPPGPANRSMTGIGSMGIVKTP